MFRSPTQDLQNIQAESRDHPSRRRLKGVDQENYLIRKHRLTILFRSSKRDLCLGFNSDFRLPKAMATQVMVVLLLSASNDDQCCHAARIT
jgi:hypothetical protein